MDAFYQRTLKILELDRVLEMLADGAVCDAAKRKCLEITPENDLREIEARLTETEEARALTGRRGAPSFSGVRDVSASLSRAEMGGTLNMKELLEIADLLRASRMARAYVNEEDQKNGVARLFLRLQTNKYLEDRITSAVLSPEEMADSASPELFDIRRHIRSANARIRETLQRIITSPSHAKHLQDPIITMRSDRYVVPVKAEYRNEVSGLTHDVSSSGATLFIEPMQVVQLNNELRELALKEQREVERILSALSAEVAGHQEAIFGDYQILVRLDVVFAKARLSYKMDAAMPEITETGGIYLKKARHPLLDPQTAVPITVRLGDEFDTLVVTGPNTGGKTVTLKTLGLLALMAACGLHIPVSDGSRVPVFSKVFADVGDEQSIEQSLSTFSSHMVNIVEIMRRADSGTLVLLDELGAGTDPVEGAALAMAIIQALREKGARVAATTHYAELKTFAMTTPGVENASCEFDVQTLRPTYRLLIGIPGRSNAFAISERLGLSPQVIERARSFVDTGSARFEDVLAQLELKRQAMERAMLDAQVMRRRAEEAEKRAERLLEQAESERGKAAEKARAEASRILEQAKAASKQVFSELDDMRKTQSGNGDWQRINDARAQIRRRINQAGEEIAEKGSEDMLPMPPQRPIKKGDTVEIRGVGTRASVLSPPDKDGNLLLQAGIMRVTAKLNEVKLVEGEAFRPPVAQSGAVPRGRQAATELDLRGMASDEAVMELERFLDGAVISGIGSVSVIHGKGTGALRAAVQAALKKDHRVKGFRLGRYGEGETGVTIVELG